VNNSALLFFSMSVVPKTEIHAVGQSRATHFTTAVLPD
jgi:hypothetical protein